MTAALLVVACTHDRLSPAAAIPASTGQTRPAAVAGGFYPAAVPLSKQVAEGAPLLRLLAVMEVAWLLGADRVEILGDANPWDAAAGARGRVVGYGAAAIYGKEGGVMKSTQSQGPLDEEQQRKLLRLARRTIEEYVRDHRVIEVREDDLVLQQPRGVFVTLQRQGMLRGCIGDLEGRMPLYLNVRDKAIASAAQDLRFDPVRANELDDLTIEISVLSPMEKVEDPLALVAGKHGVMVCQGRRAGVYLPQVATEQGWTMEETLNHLCLYKAGLPGDAWRQDAEVYCFTAQVFGEQELGR